MGRFFTNIQIKKDKTQTPQQFSEVVKEIMRKRGYSPAAENDGEISYFFTFSQNGEWVTSCSSEYNENKKYAGEDLSNFASHFPSCVIYTEVVDSDFAMLNIINCQIREQEMIVIGEPYMELPHSEKRKKEIWESILTDDKSWEQLNKVIDGDYTFAEEGLAEIAKLVGIEPENMLLEHSDSGSQSKDNTLTMYFKKADKKKSLTLNAVFKQVFGEALEPLGFKKIKGKQPYFIRVVEGGEIIHVITYDNTWCSKQDYKEFCIYCGVATVYRNYLSIDKPPSYNKEWFSDIRYILKKELDFSYLEDDNNSILNAVTKSLEYTKNVTSSVLDNIKSLEDCIKHYDKYGPVVWFCLDDNNFGNDNPSNNYNESMLYILVQPNSQYFDERYATMIDNLKTDLKKGLIDIDYYKQRVEEKKRLLYRKQFLINEIINDGERYQKYLEELERRKNANIERLRSYGVKI